MTTRTVLLLDAQTTQALACARALGRAGYRVLGASIRARPLAAWSRYCSDHFRLTGESPAAYASLRAWAAARGVAVVLPLTERSCVLLNLQRADWQEAGILPGCAPQQQLDACFDKARTIRIAERAGVAVPRTRLPRGPEEAHAIARELGLPVVVKSRHSCTWTGREVQRDRGTTYVRTTDELAAAIQSHRMGEHEPIVQAFVPGCGKGVFTVCDRGRPLAWFAHERLRDVRPTGSGSSLRRCAPLDPRLREPAERLLAAMRWHGPAMVEFRDDGTSAPWLMEVNGRFWGSLQLAVSAGIDFPTIWIRTLFGEPPGEATPSSADVTLRWWWGDAKRLLYVMSGAPPGYPGPFPSRMQGLREVFGRQPPGTRSETWDRDDPWPALGEWVQGVGELLDRTSAPPPA